MTSTVLDVTVLLLCVSASVVALGAVDDDRGPTGPDAAEVADLIATETVTMTYASAEAPNGTRTVHATRAGLLALVAVEPDRPGEKRAAREAFESEVLAVVMRAIGPRTRIDVELHTEVAERNASGSEGEAGSPSPIAGVGTSRWESNGSATPSRPAVWQLGPNGPGERQGPTGTGVPWRLDRDERSDESSEVESPATESGSAGPITVGREPPRGADVRVAVIRHPTPGAEDAARPVKIVIRRW